MCRAESICQRMQSCSMYLLQSANGDGCAGDACLLTVTQVIDAVCNGCPLHLEMATACNGQVLQVKVDVPELCSF